MESRMPCTHSGRLRAVSVSSIRSTIVPPDCRANTQLNSTERALPTWNIPVGEGAKRTRTAEWAMDAGYRVGCQEPHGIPPRRPTVKAHRSSEWVHVVADYWSRMLLRPTGYLPARQ